MKPIIAKVAKIGDRLDPYVTPRCIANCDEQGVWRVLDLYYCDSHLPEADIQSAEWLGVDIVTTP